MSADFPTPQRGAASQPRVQPWDREGGLECVLKERRIDRSRVGDTTVCGVPSERGNVHDVIPRVQPWDRKGGLECVLKERRIGRSRVGDTTVCGVPSERGNVHDVIPRALPWAGMQGPFGARIPCSVGASNLAD
jgi:hypothetical protein